VLSDVPGLVAIVVDEAPISGHQLLFCLLLNLSGEFYAKRVQPLMYDYIRDKKYFQRNATISEIARIY
jgi:hypothetical protein